jgi:hypothetical protein
LVSGGFETPQEISEIPVNISYSIFQLNIIKKHVDQYIVLTSSAGTVKVNDDIIVDGDTLSVTSADGQNMTKYVLLTGTTSLNSDVELTAKEGSGYVISQSGSIGTIKSIPPEITIAQILENIIVPEKAALYIIDDSNNLIPLQTSDANGSYSETRASGNLFFEVIAEDNFTTITYKLEFDLNEDEAYAWSYVYAVDQDKSIISQLSSIRNVSSLFKHLYANLGAGIQLIDRAGVERVSGPLDLEDYIIVTSANGSKEKRYELNFDGEVLGSEATITSDTFDIDQENFIIDSILLNTPIDEFLEHITLATYAYLLILDMSMSPMPSSTLDGRHSVQVTSGDGLTQNIYNFNFYEIFVGTEAYITSDTFNINQETFIIDRLLVETPISVFMANISVAPNATVTILDAGQSLVSSGNLEQDYTIVVTSEDGLTEVVYTIVFYEPDSVPGFKTMPVRIYPNPANDLFTIDGMEAPCTIEIVNIYGTTVRIMENQYADKIKLSIKELNSGLYFIKIAHENYKTAAYKIIIN